MSDYVEKNLEYTLTLYKDMGMPDETISMIRRSADQIQYILMRIIPGIAAVSILFITWANILMSNTLFLSHGLPYSDFGQLNRWKTPDFLVWGVIGAGAMLLIPEKGLKTIGINVLLILFVIYFFQGIAIVAFFFEKKQLPRLLRIIIYSLIGFQQIILLFIVGIGFFDVWLDLRKLNAKEEA